MEVNKALSIKKVQLLYFNVENTSFKAKIGFTFENLWIFWGKVLNFSNVSYHVLISHFCHLRTFGEKVIYLKCSYKKVLIKNECNGGEKLYL